MEIKINQVIGAGGLAAAVKILWKFLRRQHRQSPEEMSLREALELLKRTVIRIELLVSDLPELREQVARHETKLAHLSTSGDAMRFDILKLQQDAEERDQRIERLKRRLDARD